MPNWVLPSRCKAVLVPTLFFLSLILTMPLFAAGPKAPQNGAVESGPRIWLQRNQPLPVQHVAASQGTGTAGSLDLAGLGNAQPVSLTAGDLDGDGLEDLVVGYSSAAGGYVSIHRGNIDAFAPQSDASFQAIGRGEFPSPFHLEAQTFSVPVHPDFLALGNFTGQGNKDLAVAARGGSILHIFPNDGKGNLGAPQTITAGNGITALAAGRLGQTDTLIVGGGRSLTVYVSLAQGLTALASYPTSGAVSNILFGDFGDAGPDVAFLAGGKIQILRSATMQVGVVGLPVKVSGFALGSFIYDRAPGTQIALVAPDGSVQIAVHNEFDPRQYSADEWRAIAQGARVRTEPNPLLPGKTFPVNGWQVVESFPGVASLSPGQTPVFFRTRVSSNGNDDVMLLNPFSGQLALISHPDVAAGSSTFLPGQVSLRPYSGTPIAALPMRINVDGRAGVMAIHQGEIAPSMIMPIPDPTFTVDDPTDELVANACSTPIAGKCSLREAIVEANATAGTDTIMVPAGTFTLTIARNAADHHTSKTGTLEVQDSVNIIGAGQATTIIQGGTQANLSDSVDKVISFNQDIDSFTNATVSVSNLTFQNGNNKGDAFTVQDGYGGVFDFDTGLSGNNTLTMTNVTINNGKVSDGQGGGFTIFNTKNGTGSASCTGCIVQNNNSFPSAADSLGDGGGIVIDARSHIILSNTQVINNTAHANAGINATGGGFFMQGQHTQPQSHISGSTISGNTAAGIGGGMNTIATLLIDGNTVIKNNTAGKDGNNFGGGGIRNDSFDGLSLSKVTITGNSTTGNGGAIFTGDGSGINAVTISFSRLAGNTSSLNAAGNNLFNFPHTTGTLGNQVTAQNNWWGTDNPGSTIISPSTVCPAVSPNDDVCFDPFIVLTHTSAANPIQINQSTGLTADMSKDNHGNAVGLANLTEIIGLPITFNTATLGSVSGAGTTLNANAQATATFNAGATASSFAGTLFGGANANVDQEARPTDSFFITSATEAASTATITTAGAHGFSTGQHVQIAGVGVSGYNTPANQLSTVASTPTANTFTYNPGTSGLAASSGGNVRSGIIILEPPSITKTFGPKTVQSTNFNAAAFSTITFNITNPNVVPIDASFTDNLPVVGGNKLVVASSPGVTNTCTGSTFAPSAGDASLSFSTPSLAVGTCTITVKVSAAVDDNYTNSVTIDSTAAGNGNTASDTLTVINPPSIAKNFGALTIPLNGTTSLTITVSNNNNVNQTLSGITFTDTLPNTTGTLVVATPSNLTDNCSGGATATPGSGSVSLASSSLAVGASCTVSANVQGTAAGAANNSVTAIDATAGAGAAGTASVTIIAPPSIAKAFNPSSIPLNGTSTLTFTITNPAANTVAESGVAFSDTLPTGLVVATPNGLTNSCGGTPSATAGGTSISLTGGSIAVNSSCTLVVNVTGTAAGSFTNTSGAVSSTNGGTGNTASDTLTVVAPPSIAKAFNPNSIPLNGTSTLTFTITNPSANTVAETGVAFTDTLPTGLVVATPNGLTNSCGGTPSATAGGTSISLTGGSIAVNSSCTVVVNVTGGTAGAFTNTSGAVSSTNGGTGNTASDTLTVVAPPSITKAFNPTTIALNGTTTLTFTITNPAANTVAEAGVAFSDTLPTGLVVATPNGLTNSCGGTPSATAGGTSISLTGGSIAVNSSCTVVVNVTGTTGGAFTNTSGAVSSTNGGTGNTASANLTVVAPPSIAKAFSPKSIPVNGTSTLTFTITNPAANTVAATGVAFSDTLPTGLVVATPNGLTNTCGGTPSATAGGTSISLTAGSIAVNSSCTVVVNVTGGTAGAFSNTSGAVSSTNGGTGNTANDTLTVVAPPSIAKAFNPTTIALNGTTTLTFTITNPVANTVAEAGVAFSDTLPTGLVVATPNGLTNTCSGTPSATAGGTSISLTGGSIAVNSSCTVVVNVTGTASGQYTNTSGAVSSTNGGTGNTASANLTVASPPSITKGFNPKTIPLNGTSTLTFTIQNPNTNVALTGVAFTDTLPTGLVVSTPNGLTNSCGGTPSATAGGTSISLTAGGIAVSSSCTVVVNVTGTTAGAFTNTSGAVTSNEGGAGNTATDTLTVVGPPSIAKAFSPNSIPVNGTSTLTFTITNPAANTVAQAGVAFSDTLPAGLIVATPNGLTNSCGGTPSATAGGTSISLTGGSIAVNSSCTVVVNVTGGTAGAFTNTSGAVSSTNGGTGNTATNTLTVVAPPSIAKVFNPNTIALNATTSLQFTITNPAGNTVAENGVAFTDTLPTGLTVASGTSTVCGGTLTTTNPTGISLVGATIAVSGQCQFSVTVTGAASGQYTNTTGAVSSTNGGTGNTASTNLTVASPPSITKSFNPTSIVLNANSTLSFSISNPNTGVALSGVAFTDTLPSGVVVAATPNVTGSCGSGTITATAGSGSISLSGGTLTASPAPGSTCNFSVDVTGTTAGVKNNSVQVTSTEGGPGNTSNASLTVTAASTGTAVASSANPSVFGQSVTFMATVTNTSAGSAGAPTGSVQFVVDGVNFGSPVALTGASSTTSTAASAAIATLSVAGSPHTVSANYVNGDGNFINSTGSLAGGQSVTQAITNTAVVSSANPSVVGESVTFTATVVDVSAGSVAQPTGSVQFVVDGVNFGSPVTLTGASSNSSTATSQATTTLSIGGSPHSVTANYLNGDGNFVNSTASLSGGQVVTKANTTTSVNSSAGTITLGDTVTFTATVAPNPPASGTPTGLVVFFDGSTPIASGTLNGSAQATFSTAVLAVGSHSITAIYNGDANFTASPLSSPTIETVNLRTSATALGLNPTTVGAGQPSTATVTVTDSGSVPPGIADTFNATDAPSPERTGFTSTLFADGLVLVAGGTDSNNNVLKSADIVIVSSASIAPTGNLNTARTGAVAVLLPNGKVLVAGGSSDGTANGALNSAELFDPVAGTFAPTSHNMTAARFGTTATILNNGKVLLAGGSNSGGVLNSAELYDPAADTFTVTGNLNAARTGASATLLGNGKVLVAGGSSNGTGTGALSSAEVFDPGAGTFAPVAGANLGSGRWQPEAALLLSGKVLVAGGQNSGGPQTTADIYDSVADSFTASGHQMNEARANGSAVAMPNGMVLLPGGTTSQTVDLYDADSDKFNTTGSLLHHLNGSAATLLNNGQALVVGINIDSAPTLLSDAELYSPSFNPLGTVGFGSSEPTDVFGPACVLTPSTSTASTCATTVTPIHVATSPHTITGTYPADAVHSTSNNTASLTVIPAAPPTIAKAFSASAVGQNSKVNVSFTIVNPSTTGSLTGISFTDALPAGLVVATPNNLVSNCGGTFTAVAGSSAMSLTGGTVGPATAVPASGLCVITVDLLVTGTGTISNTTGVISSNESGPGTTSNTATITVVLAPTVNKAFGAVSIPLSGTTSLTFNIANPNTTIALDGIALSDTLPSGLAVATPNGLTGSCVASSLISANPGGNSISLTALNLAATGSCSFSVNVKGTAGGTENNTTAPITATFDDGTGTFRVVTGGTASASIVVVAPPSIAKAFVPPAIAPGGVSTLTFTITNPAVNTAALNGVGFTDTLPANVLVATPNGLTGNCNGGTVTATAGSGMISLTGGTIPAASSCIISVNVTSSVPGSYTNTTGAVSSTNGGTGNTATAVLSVAHANLSITKTHVGNFPRNSTGNNYTITVSNAAGVGPTVGTVTVTDTLPNVQNTLVPTAMSGTGWTCTLGTLTCTRSDALAPGASFPPITLTVTVPQNIQANVTNSATVSGGGDPNSHTANDPTHIGPPIQVTIAINNVTVNVGATQFVNFTVDSSPGEGNINFACTGLPFGASCSFNPPSTNQLSASVTMGITTSAGTTASLLPLDPGTTPPVYTALLPLLGLMGLILGRKRGKAMRLRFALVLGSLVVLLALMGCGGGGRPILPTPSGTYTITVAATSVTTGDTGSATITLTVP